MRSLVWIVPVCCLVLACSKRQQDVSPCDVEPLAALIKKQPGYVVCAAADVVPGGSAVADSTFESGWQADEPRYLQKRTDPAKLNAGILDVCDLIDDLPVAQGREAAAGIDSWVASYNAIGIAEEVGIEFFATAVAQTPQMRAAIPASVLSGERRNVDPGETMASGEFSEMNYALTRILYPMPAADRDRILADVRARAGELITNEERTPD